MSFELHERKHLQDELPKTVRRVLSRPVRDLAATSGGTAFENAVHESRKSVKKVSAVVALLEEAGAKVPRKDRKRLKSAARALSRLRDSVAIIESFNRVRRRYPKQLTEQTYGIVRRSLVRARHRLGEQAKRDGVIVEAAKQLAKFRKSAKAWTSPSIDVSDLAPIIVASYRRSRNAMKRSRDTGQSATLHSWRKEIKTLWYQLRLVNPLITGETPLIADLKRLETDLGDDHNLVVLEATLRSCRELRSIRAEIRQMGRLAAQMRQLLRRRAFTIGLRAHARTPSTFARSIRVSVKPGAA